MSDFAPSDSYWGFDFRYLSLSWFLKISVAHRQIQTDLSGSCRVCRYLQVSCSSHACRTSAHVSTYDEKAAGLIQHRGLIPRVGTAASFTFNQMNNHHATLTACLSTPGLGDESEIKLPLLALLHSCCCLCIPFALSCSALSPCAASD